MQLQSDHLSTNVYNVVYNEQDVMKLAGCIKHAKTSYMPKDQGKFDFSCYDPFN